MMEDCVFNDQPTSSAFNYSLPPGIYPSVDNSEGSKIKKSRIQMHCIICSRTVSTGSNGEGEDEGGGGYQIAGAKLVIEAPGFLTTFNEIWRILHRNQENDGVTGTDAGITLTTLTDGSRNTDITFKEAPIICQRCCEKVVGVENLIKAVKQQVREIKMLYEQCRRKGDGFTGLLDLDHRDEQEQYIPQMSKSEHGEIDDSADMQIKEDDWHWQEPDPSTATEQASDPFYSQIKTSFISEASDNETPMECDDDVESEDPDYIKSEDETDDDEDYEEIPSGSSENEEEQEKVITLKNESADLYSTVPDPLAHNSMTTFATKPSLAPGKFRCDIGSCTEAFTNSAHLSRHVRVCHPGQSPSKNPQKLFTCDVEGCGKSLKNEMGLFLHKQKIHGRKSPKIFPCDVPGCTKTFTSTLYIPKHKQRCHPEVVTLKTGDSSTFICNLEGCSRVCAHKGGLHTHQMKCHPGKMAELNLAKDKSVVCSCGLKFRSDGGRYHHMLKNLATHPECKPGMRSGNYRKCDLCSEAVLQSDLLFHYISHVGSHEYVISCPNDKCGEIFLTSVGIQLHFNQAKGCGRIGKEKKTALICDTCGFTSDNRWALRNHVESVHELLGVAGSKKEIKCPISGCEKMFNVKQSIYFHLSAHRSKKIRHQGCDKCGKRITLGGMEEHFKDKHGIEEKDVFGCKQCEFKFSGREELLEHVHEHRNEGIICDVCDNQVKYTRYSDFREHYLGVHGLCPKRYKCEECGMDFWTKKNRYEHGQAKHNDKKYSTKKVKCDLCLEDEEQKNVEFGNQLELISHKIKVHGMEPFKCDSCGRTFKAKGDWSRHMKEHAGVEFKKDWRCEVEGCGRVFSTKYLLARHRNFGHGAQKPFVCDECGKGFDLANKLRKHRETVHLKLKKFVCEECGEGFTSGNVLRRHKLIHTGERPFGCEVCGQRFRHKEVLRRHLVGHEEKGADFKPNGPMKQLRKRKAQ